MQMIDEFIWNITQTSQNFNSNIIELANCFVTIHVWKGNNKFVLNLNKTEFILIGDDGARNSFKVIISCKPPWKYHGINWICKKNLCVILDADNSMQRHVANLCCVCYCILLRYNLITYRAVNFSRPRYLSSLIKHSDLSWGKHLSVSSTRPNEHMEMRFAVAAPTEWNILPQSERRIVFRV